MFNKNRKIEKKANAIKLVDFDQKNQHEDSDADKISLFSKKSFIQRKI